MILLEEGQMSDPPLNQSQSFPAVIQEELARKKTQRNQVN